ncbi:metalloprotease [Rhizobium sp. Root708]|uniref:AprI/Inh family metalloprotease inhibitor n=1 Tax=Rhizobium sp. Root708 TaxID=1736592 RepID=UPI0006F60BE4|nr:AprI/Inh family metalloprotease inhibitor [Rhizobium sp. Root708]KRB50383.1 metalloprotease [Rhizobium sp. Root708]
MIRLSIRSLVLAAGVFASVPVLADDVDADIIKAQAGSYLLAPADGTPGCRITLETTTAIGGYAISGADGCSKALPHFVGASAWNFGDDGNLIVLDATRKVLARFIESEGSPLATEGDQPLLLLDAPDGVDRVPTVASLAGEWRLKRPAGQLICAVTLQDKQGEDGNAPMSPARDCDKAIANLHLSLFHVEGFGLVLMSTDGSSLSFDMKPDGSFEKSPDEGGKPLVMIRSP